MERDDLIVNDSYSLEAHHSAEDGAKIRKKIWTVTAILTGGLMSHRRQSSRSGCSARTGEKIARISFSVDMAR